LGANKDIMAAKKSERVKRLKEALYRNCRTFGFGRDFEGFGMPTPASQVMEKKRNAKNRATRRG
ncbi:hypothetical protein QR510_30865, partial [Escherichia coli]|uniref:hypothetical protein n=1 Tax=Escherichia coli TaxID=562 RepID=UPI00273948E7